MDSFTKQSYEEFVIYGDIVDVQLASEALVVGSCSVLAEDKDGSDVTNTVLDVPSLAVGDSPDGGTLNTLEVRCRAGAEDSSPYKITFYMETNQSNKWEVDVKMKIKEI